MPVNGDVCRLINVGDKPYSEMYANQRYVAAPGQELIAPFEAVCLWLGHPDAIDLGEPDKNYRTDELHRLRIRFGVLDIAVEDPNSGHINKSPDPCCPFNQEQQWEYNKPRVEVHDLSGSRVITVVDDPTGDSITPATSTVATNAALVEQMEQMRRQMVLLQARIDAADRTEKAEADSGPIESDEAPATSVSHATIPAPESEDVTEDAPTRVRVGSKA